MIVAEDHPSGAPPALTAADLRDIAEALSAEFLAAYLAEEERVDFEVAALDPYRLRVRWQAPAGALEKARAELGEGARAAPLTVRFHFRDATAGAPPYDVFLDERADERVFAFRRGGAAYRIEFGLLAPNGAVKTLAPAADVATPPAAPAPTVDLTLRDIRFSSASASRPRVFDWSVPAPAAAGGATAAQLAATVQSGAAIAPLLLAAGSGAPADTAPPREAIAWP